MSFFPSRSWDAEDRIILGCISRPFGLSLHVLGNVSPRRGPWALMYSGPGSQILWPHNSPLKSCCPAPRTERRVLMTSGLCHNLSILAIYQYRTYSSARDTFLALRYVKRVFIKCRRLYAPHVQRCDGNLTVKISLPLWAGKFAQLHLMGSINNF